MCDVLACLIGTQQNAQLNLCGWHSFIIISFFAQCDTGIALLAYMDGITGSPTLGGVVLATLSAAGYAVFKVCDILHARYINIHNCIIFRHGNIKIWHDKLYSQVMFRKVMGDPPVAQIAFTFTILGFINAALCWPISLCLYLTGTEVMPWESLSWTILFTASVLMLGKCCGRTYEYEVRQR